MHLLGSECIKQGWTWNILLGCSWRGAFWKAIAIFEAASVEVPNTLLKAFMLHRGSHCKNSSRKRQIVHYYWLGMTRCQPLHFWVVADAFRSGGLNCERVMARDDCVHPDCFLFANSRSETDVSYCTTMQLALLSILSGSAFDVCGAFSGAKRREIYVLTATKSCKPS